MDRLEGRFAIDELFLPTLQATSDLNIPGAFTRACLDKGIPNNHVTR